MFSESEKPPADRVPWIIAAVMGVLLAVASGGVYYFETRDSGGTTAPAAAARTEEDEIRDDVLIYVAQPKFSGDAFEKQIFGGAHMEFLELGDREVYFSLPESAATTEALAPLVAGFLVVPTNVVVATETAGVFHLGQYSMLKQPGHAALFKTPIANVRIARETVLRFPFKTVTYTLTLPELLAYTRNAPLYGGRLTADTGNATEHAGIPIVMANHGAFVAKPGEASLGRLVAALTKGIPADAPGLRERRIQRALDFVTNEIAYDAEEASFDFETLKRPDETIMSRRSDCSNKTILFASLLEQMGEDYLLVYMPHHISVAVPAGAFPTSNGLGFDYGGARWVVAETTARDFRIGVDHLSNEKIFRQLYFVQRPKNVDDIRRFSNDEPLEFR